VPPAPAPRRHGWLIYSVAVSILLFLSVIANLVMLAMLLSLGGGDGFTARRARFQEELVDGSEHTRDKIAVVNLAGIIALAEEGNTGDEGIVGYVKDQLRQAVDDKHVKAIVLRINSPGGEVVASDMIYQAIVEARSEKPVVACIDSVGASGGYYVAVGADQIVATDMTITGSIGVILQSYSFAGLADKVGVKVHTFKSGRYKDLLNPAREPTPEEEALVNGLIMEVYDKFVGIVASEREIAVDKLKEGIADGRILSGKQAKEAGLVDELGSFDDAVDVAKDLAKIKEAKVIRYLVPFSLRDLFRYLGQQDRAKVQLQIGPEKFKLQSGRLYFLPPSLVE
jgi:protease-4